MNYLKSIKKAVSLYMLIFLCVLQIFAQKKDNTKKDADKPKDPMSADVFNGLKFRSIGPAFCSGRIADFAVNPKNHSEYYVAVAAGNVWKTTNSGQTWTPIFDSYGSWSIANVVIDPNNTNVVWVGTGEFNSQRAIGYGDGIYRSEDGGKSFKNMGLKNSEHIGRIVIDPRNSNIYVAVQGPLWGAGGDRGLYKSTDNGKTWNKILNVSDNTGISDIVFDPRNPDVLYAASYQRRRHVYTLIDGGPESAIYKSTDAGATWNKLESGLPSGDVGRIGLAISPVNPDVLYATIEASGDAGGFFRSKNRGATWEKMNSWFSGSPQYYNRLFADPLDVDKVYDMDTQVQLTTDGGKTFHSLNYNKRHVDDHALWIDPSDTRHILIGGDGGIYETYDGNENWRHIPNLPVTQFYRVAVDNALPFYNVYGGTQDNASIGAPSRTLSEYGIVNDDWIVTQGGDGFFSRIDPENPNIIYAEAQYGDLVRYDKLSSESISIQPQPPAGEAYRWNWNSPLIISNFSSKTIYFAANKLFKSDDRGNTWKVVSPDLTRQLDRNKLPVFGKILSVDAVAKNASTSFYGNIVSLCESPVKKGLLFVGTDDGLIQVTDDDGANWTKYEKFLDVNENTYISCLLASKYDANVVYAAFDGRKLNDLKPHLMKSLDKGKTWKSITANLPERGTIYCIAEDFINKDLLFVGTEFGVYFTVDGGNKWIQLKGGLPTTAVYDMAIQQRENDLVLATFGRGFYILDDYSVLRQIKAETLATEAAIFPIKDALMFIQSEVKYGQGDDYYAGQNPAWGATFTYFMKESIPTKKELRQKAEKEAIDKGNSVSYPSYDELRAEDDEIVPFLLFTIYDETGNIVRKLKTSPSTGINRIVWNFRYTNSQSGGGDGILALPGNYKVSLSKVVNGVVTELVKQVAFKTVPLNNTILPAANRKAVVDFQKQVAEFLRVVIGTSNVVSDASTRIKSIRNTLNQANVEQSELLADIAKMQKSIFEIIRAMNGDRSLSTRNENQPPSIQDRINNAVYTQWRSTSEVTQTQRDQFKIACDLFEVQYYKLKQIVEIDLPAIEKKLESLQAPYTPGRLPVWKK